MPRPFEPRKIAGVSLPAVPGGAVDAGHRRPCQMGRNSAGSRGERRTADDLTEKNRTHCHPYTNEWGARTSSARAPGADVRSGRRRSRECGRSRRRNASRRDLRPLRRFNFICANRMLYSVHGPVITLTPYSVAHAAPEQGGADDLWSSADRAKVKEREAPAPKPEPQKTLTQASHRRVVRSSYMER